MLEFHLHQKQFNYSSISAPGIMGAENSQKIHHGNDVLIIDHWYANCVGGICDNQLPTLL